MKHRINTFLYYSVLLFVSCEGKSNPQEILQTNYTKLEKDTSNTLTILNRSKIAVSTFCIHPHIGESDCYIEINNNNPQGKNIKISEKFQVLFSSNNLIHYIIKDNDRLKVIDADEKKIGYKITGIEDTLRDNELLFFYECYKNKIPLMMEESFNGMLQFLKRDELKNNLEKLYALYNVNSVFAKSYFHRYPVSKKFSEYILDYVKYDFYNKIYTYITDKSIIDSLRSANFFDKKLDETNEYNVSNFKFYYFLINDFKHSLNRLLRTQIFTADSIFNLIESDYSASNGQYLKFYFLKTNLDSLLKLNKAYVSNEVISLENVDQRRVLLNRIQDKETSTIDIDVIVNQEGKELSLKDIVSDYKNKVVYIDFWASWCAPCRKEFKFYSKLKKEIKEGNIQFIFISIDQSKQAWSKAVASENLNSFGDNFLLSNPSASFKKKYNLYSIPNYIIFDKSAKVVTTDAPQPSSAAIKPLLLRLLGK
jgi:thiol-disulfide isomerase/thioredoxin